MTKFFPNKTAELVAGTHTGYVGDLLDQLFGLNEQVATDGFHQAVAAMLNQWIPYDSISLFEFSRDLQPRVLFSLGEQYDVEMTEYLSGLYLIDPMYELFVRDSKTGVFLFNIAGEDEFGVSESFMRYWRKLAGQDEIGMLMPVSASSCAHMSIFVSFEDKQEIAQANRFAELIFTPLSKMYARHLTRSDERLDEAREARRQVHAAVSKIMSNFGDGVLTAREQEIAQLLLKGHSAKSIARILGISPGTSAIHRSNVYKKLGVSGQGDMFASFVTRLISA